MKRSGFTLIELLVVIAIIAILAAILFPVFARARAKAIQNNCLANVKQIVLGVMMYCSDNDQKFPGCNSCGGYNAHPSWWDVVAPYIKNDQIAFCGADATAPSFSGTPATPRPSYAISGNLTWNGGAVALNFVQAPASTVMLGPISSTMGQNPREMSGGDYQYAINNNQGGIIEALVRHNNGENWGLCDGHAKFYVTPAQGSSLFTGNCAVGTTLPAPYQAGFDTNCN